MSWLISYRVQNVEGYIKADNFTPVHRGTTEEIIKVIDQHPAVYLAGVENNLNEWKAGKVVPKPLHRILKVNYSIPIEADDVLTVSEAFAIRNA